MVIKCGCYPCLYPICVWTLPHLAPLNGTGNHILQLCEQIQLLCFSHWTWHLDSFLWKQFSLKTCLLTKQLRNFEIWHLSYFTSQWTTRSLLIKTPQSVSSTFLCTVTPLLLSGIIGRSKPHLQQALVFLFTSQFHSLLNLSELPHLTLMVLGSGLRSVFMFVAWKQCLRWPKRVTVHWLLRYFLKHFNYIFMCSKRNLLYLSLL